MDEQNPRAGSGQERRPAKKRRRRRGGLRSVAKALLFVVIVIGISVLLASAGWIFAQDVLALNKEPHSAVINLPERIFTEETVEVETKDKDGNTMTYEETVQEADMEYVAAELSEKGLIRFPRIFKLFAKVSHAKTKMVPGSYTLTTEMDYSSLINNMSPKSTSKTEITVTIPEGYTVGQIFDLLEEKGVASKEDLTEVAANHDYKFDFLEGLPLGSATRLEGYLFPDTYRFYIGESPLYAINKMLVNFDSKVTDDMRKTAEEKGLTLHEIITIASLIERETDGTDQAVIASVIYNRLNNPWADTAGYLQIDAAIYYVTGREVTPEDYQSVDSPYNTYLYQGLPPTAIANPGAEAIWSALHPLETGYYYYALGVDGVHHFSRSLQEHLNFLASLPADEG